MLLGEVGKLHEERKELQNKIYLLLRIQNNPLAEKEFNAVLNDDDEWYPYLSPRNIELTAC